MRHSFAPFDDDARYFLMSATGVDYRHTNFAGPDWLCVSCRDDSGKLMGLCAFEFKTWFDAFFSIAIRDPRCITLRVMRSMFRAVFSQAVRVTAEIDPGNAAAIHQARRMGFEPEGYKRFAIEGRRDAVLFGMTADTCRYLRTRLAGSYGPENEDFDGKQPQAS